MATPGMCLESSCLLLPFLVQPRSGSLCLVSFAAPLSFRWAIQEPGLTMHRAKVAASVVRHPQPGHALSSVARSTHSTFAKESSTIQALSGTG